MTQATQVKEYVAVRNLVKRYGAVQAVQGVSFSVREGEVVALLGPSGCGKTTILRCLAGLEAPDGGSIRIGDVLVDDVAARLHLSPEAREIGMVFQSYAVWPHMTVYDNVAFPLQVRRRPAAEVKERVYEALQLVGLEGFANRPAPMLSGGQQQRVALARALVSHPKVVLFDEPLSNLDARLRERMRFELANLQQRIGFTAVYVTHDQEEAMALAHQLVLLQGGSIQQVGPPEAIYREPANAFVAEFVGFANSLPGTVAAAGSRPQTALVELEGGLGQVEVRTGGEPARGREVLVVFRPEQVRLADQPLAGYNCLPARVQSALYLGHCFDYGLSAGQQSLRMRGMPAAPPAVGDPVHVCVAPDDCYAVPR